MDGVPHDAFDRDSVDREVGLIVLEAAALARRVFPPNESPGGLSRELRQTTLALALAGAVTDLEEHLTPRAVAHLLALDREEALDTFAELTSLGLAELGSPEAFESEDISPLDAGYRLTESGRALALNLAQHARRFLRGWPPEVR